MSYADTIRTVVADFDHVADLIEGTLVDVFQVVTGATSTTSTSPVVMSTLSQSVTIPVGATAVIITNTSLSHSSAGGVIDFGLYYNGTIFSHGRRFTSTVGTTAGNNGTHTMVWTNNTEGTGTFDFRWSVVTAGTAYCPSGVLIILVFQTL